MLLADLIGSDASGLGGNPEISGLAVDSRQVRPGYLFAALAGHARNGAEFIDEAIARGAVAVLAVPEALARYREVVAVPDVNPRRRLATLAARFYGNRQPPTIVAVTGTNGKTSVVSFAAQLWSRLSRKAASLGTLGVLAPGFEMPLPHTTPEPVTLHRILAELAAQDVACLAIEASSHGLDQYRLDGVTLSAAAFTNLTRDHFDYHANADAYLKAKLRLFEDLLPTERRAVINADSDMFSAFAAACQRRRHRLITFGRKGVGLKLIELRPEPTSQILRFDAFGRTVDLRLPLVGAFQAMNALCAFGLVAEDRYLDALLEGLENLRGVPGRLERVGRHSSGAPVYVDYAHTPDALETVLRALRPHAKGRVVVVFGCGGDRDRGKRPAMGRIACEHADTVIVTDDNPRSEPPEAIRRAILEACTSAGEIGDRRAAIGNAIAGLAAGDILIIAGKGHERGQIVGDKILPFDDRQVARECLVGYGGVAA